MTYGEEEHPHAECRERIAELEAENELLLRAARSLRDLINESHGVYGLHLNGDNAPWADLLEGGKYDEWLEDFSKVLPIL